jgi:hypothetical protein
MAGERIARIRIQRDPTMLYYVKADEEGWLCVYKTQSVHKGKSRVIKRKYERAQL